jgi:hypothetical protein
VFRLSNSILLIVMKLWNSTSSYGWVQACANWRERERERQICTERERERDCVLIGAEMVSSTVMYNFGGGPRGDPMNLAF